jgi:hypothetical protein
MLAPNTPNIGRRAVQTGPEAVELTATAKYYEFVCGIVNAFEARPTTTQPEEAWRPK